MSGICAVWRRGNPERLTETLTAVSEGLSLVAPKHLGRATDGEAGVGLSARFGTQQIYKNIRVLVACDADLQNEAELTALVAGREFATENAMTACLLAGLYARFGDGFVEKLRGAFSVVLWDRLERRLLAAVDPFGIKRLVYYEDGNTTLVASRIDALMKSGEISSEINPKAIANVLNYSANLAPETILTRVNRLIPGGLLLVSNRNSHVTKYWDMRYDIGGEADENRLCLQLEAVVEESVAACCGNDSFADLGAFLSGGTDSSTVLGMMTRKSQGSVKAFSIGFEEQPFNELGYAEMAARKFHAEHHTLLVGAQDCFAALPDMIRFFDEPFGNSSAIPTYFCARMAAQHQVKVLLAGDGGDELFGGNERYATDKIFEIYHNTPRSLRKWLIEPTLAAAPNFLPFTWAKGYVRRANMPGVERLMSFQFLRTHSLEEVFDGNFLKSLDGYSILDTPSRYYAEAAARDHLDRLLYVDVKITLGDNDLPKVTCMSELAGIQVRFPFLDLPVAGFSGRIPAWLKVKGLEKRYLFKRAFGQLLPQEIIKKKKHGFGIPVASWLKSDRKMRELLNDTLRSVRAVERGYFRREFIEDLFRKHDVDQSSYYGDTLWTFLTLELWHRQAVDQPSGVAI
jgi:asparagine synthase (glutamine-hydrolysing)